MVSPRRVSQRRGSSSGFSRRGFTTAAAGGAGGSGTFGGGGRVAGVPEAPEVPGGVPAAAAPRDDAGAAVPAAVVPFLLDVAGCSFFCVSPSSGLGAGDFVRWNTPRIPPPPAVVAGRPLAGCITPPADGRVLSVEIG